VCAGEDVGTQFIVLVTAEKVAQGPAGFEGARKKEDPKIWWDRKVIRGALPRRNISCNGWTKVGDGDELGRFEREKVVSRGLKKQYHSLHRRTRRKWWGTDFNAQGGESSPLTLHL